MNFLKANRIWLSGLILLVGWAVACTFGYIIVSHGFIYDDRYLILQNPYLQDWKNALLFFVRDVTQTSALETTSGYYRPVSMVFLQVMFHAFELAAWKYHLVNLILHAANSICVGMIALQVTKRERLSLLAAVIFALHPVHVEAIVSINCYMGLLAALFALLATIFFALGKKSKRSFWLWLSITGYALSIFAKEEALFLPVILFVIGRFLSSDSKTGNTRQELLDLIPWLTVAALYLLARHAFVASDAAFGFWEQNSQMNLKVPDSLTGKIAGVFLTYFGYIKLWFWPHPLSPFHVLAAPATMDAWLIFILMTGVISLIIIATFRIHFMRFAWLWFFVALLLVANFIPIGGMFSERLMYLPSVGLAWLSAYCLDALLRKTSQRVLRGLFLILAIVLLGSSAASAARYAWSWQSNDAMWRRANQIYPNEPHPLSQMAKAFYDEGDLLSAASYYEKAAALESDAEAAIELRRKAAQSYGIKRQFDRAIQQYKIILARHPAYWLGWFELGWTHYVSGDFEGAKKIYNELLERNPGYPRALFGLAELAFERGDSAAARALYDEALRQQPDTILVQLILKNLRNRT